MKCYRLAPNQVTWNMWVEYDEDPKTTPMVDVRRQFAAKCCKSCRRVDPGYIPSLSSVDVSGYKDRYSLLALTSDGYTVCNEEFHAAVGRAGVGGIRFIPISGSSGSYIIMADAQLSCVTDKITFKDVCEKCGRARSSFGEIREIEKPKQDKVYVLSFAFERGYAMNRQFVFNESVAALLEHHGADMVVREMRGAKWIKTVKGN